LRSVACATRTQWMRRRTVSKKTGNGDDGALILNPRERERGWWPFISKSNIYI
jgi:hypothetical protein